MKFNSANLIWVQIKKWGRLGLFISHVFICLYTVAASRAKRDYKVRV